MEPFDIHTHHLPQESYQAIISIMPKKFNPLPDRYYSVGLHPWYLLCDYKEEWEQLQEAVRHSQVLAVGEAGLDKAVTVDMNLQLEVFTLQMELAEQINKPLIIHSVRTANELIRLRKQFCPQVPWIIHGFRGNKDVAQELIRHRFYLSFGEKYQIEALRVVPVNRIFIETDESLMNIRSLYEKVSTDLSLPYNQLLTSVQQNVKEVFFNR